MFLSFLKLCTALSNAAGDVYASGFVYSHELSPLSAPVAEIDGERVSDPINKHFAYYYVG